MGRVKVYMGVDHGDYYSGAEGRTFLIDLLAKQGLPLYIVEMQPPSEGALCWIWNRLAEVAYNDTQDFTVLLGDDVKVEHYHWMDQVEEEYRELAQHLDMGEQHYGFGCISLRDRACPNFPSFPIMHRFHMRMHGYLLPPDFVNQDGDPYLFALYGRFGASRFAEKVVVQNGIGGHGHARYNKKHIGWKDGLLDEGVNRVSGYLASQSATCHRIPTLDVVVPSYRCDLSILKPICQLPVANDATNIIIIVDRPEELGRVRQALEVLSRVRVRANPRNLGACAARNRGLDESAAEWVLFLDDDVVPCQDLLIEYTNAIQAKGQSSHGFIGMTRFPEPHNIHTQAVTLSDVTYMFGIAGVLPHPKWGVTANLLVKRTPTIRFLEGCWPKTGGGEDVDICLRYITDHHKAAFTSAPRALVVHPWWNGSQRSYGHFFHWAVGDGHLLDLYPEWVYWSCPNVAESMMLAMLVGLIMAVMTKCWARPVSLPMVVVMSEMIVDIIKHVVLDHSRLPTVIGARRVMVAAESTVVIISLEMGRLWGHVKRGSLTKGFMRRFEWFCGELPGAVTYERRWASAKAISHMTMCCLAILYLDSYYFITTSWPFLMGLAVVVTILL